MASNVIATVAGVEYTAKDVREWGKDPKNAKHLPEGAVVGDRGTLSRGVLDAFVSFQEKRAARAASKQTVSASV
mgnify:CR=1 FL=1